MSDIRFIEVEITSIVEFKVKELWPDGDHPDEITKESVLELIDNTSSRRRVMDDWFFPVPDIFVRIV